MSKSPPDLPLVVSVLLDALPTAVFIKDVGGHYVGVNRAFEKLSGLRREDVVGRTVFEIHPPDLAERYDTADRALYASASGEQLYEVPMAVPNGDRLEVSISKSVFRNASGEVAGLIGTFTDLTPIRRIEHQLREANDQLEHRIERRTQALAGANALLTATLESTADGILAVDHRRHVVAYNRRFLALWGIDPVKANGAGDGALLAVAQTRVRDPDGFQRKVAEIYASDGPVSDQVDLADGRVFERYSLPLVLANEPPGRVWCFRDVTHERELELEMRHAQKMEAVGRLAGGIAHDFNNLLTVILANAAIVTDTLGDEHPATPDVSEIRAAGERAAQLTRQLLTFSRKQLVVSRRIDVNRLLRDMLRMLTRLLGEDVAIDLRCDPDLGPVDGDPGQIEQVVANLCVNARDAMPSGGSLVVGTRAVPPSSTSPAGGVEITVSDTGMGMSDAVRERIFEPFFTTKERGKGTGLGLSTVYGIVTQGGGTIDVQSAPGKGTTFRVVLPRASGEPPTQAAAPHPLRAPRVTASILLVEDEAPLRRVLGRQLRAAGYLVSEAGDGVEALEVAARNDRPFDLLLTDVVMPRKSGVELARALHGSGRARSVVFMSGFSADPDQLPSDAVIIPKPFQVPELLARLAAVLAATPPAPH